MRWSIKKRVFILTGLLSSVALFSGGYLIWSLWDLTHILGKLPPSDVLVEVRGRIVHLQVVIGATVVVVLVIGGVYVKTVLWRLLYVFKQLGGVVSGLSRGRLQKVLLAGEDEFSDLARVYNSAVEHINNIIRTNQRASEVLLSELRQFSEAAANIEHSAEGQNAQIEQISSSTVEISHILVEISRNAHSTKEAAEGTKALVMENSSNIKSIADRVNALSGVVEGAVQTVSNLNTRMGEINRILETIREIAEQTNLLSLNAAIEAARAGEHGRGFAVVAEEVRKLADRSARSAEEISRIIETITEESSRTVTETEEVHKVVGEVMEHIRLTEENILSVIQAAETTLERSTAIASATEENSSAVEQISQSMEALSGASKRLFDEIKRIKEVTSELEGLARELLIQGYETKAEGTEERALTGHHEDLSMAEDSGISGNGRGYGDVH